METITIDRWDNFHLSRDEVKNALIFLSHRCKKPVHFAMYPGRLLYSPDVINVYAPDPPLASNSLELVSINGERLALFGCHATPGKPDIFSKSARDIEDDLNTVIAVVDGNCILFLVDITAEDSPATRRILSFVIEHAIPLLDFDLRDMLRDRTKQIQEETKACLHGYLQRRLAAKQSELSNAQYEANQAYETLVRTERHIVELTAEIEQLQKSRHKPLTGLAEQQGRAIQGLIGSGLYGKVQLKTDGGIVATTNEIVIRHDGYEFPMGRYSVEISPNGQLLIRCLNPPQGRKADYPHPHVDTNGNPCLGNIHGDIGRMIGKFRIAEALQVLHNFLCTYNPSSPYEKISHFDPAGLYVDEDEDTCENCDDRCSPYCIFECSQNEGWYGCSDCCDYRTDYCYTECSYNENYEYVHPCDGCDAEGTRHCYLECPYNEGWDLKNPCDDCEKEECNEECEYHRKARETGFISATTAGQTATARQGDRAQAS